MPTENVSSISGLLPRSDELSVGGWVSFVRIGHEDWIHVLAKIEEISETPGGEVIGNVQILNKRDSTFTRNQGTYDL
jgi:hypothetical protein